MSPSAQLAPGCVVLAGAVVDHDALCGFYSQLGVNAAMARCSAVVRAVLIWGITFWVGSHPQQGPLPKSDLLLIRCPSSSSPPTPLQELFQGYGTASQITALADWLQQRPAPAPASTASFSAMPCLALWLSTGSTGAWRIDLAVPDWPSVISRML